MKTIEIMDYLKIKSKDGLIHLFHLIASSIHVLMFLTFWSRPKKVKLTILFLGI